jgi:PAS domain S-box-containing protein
LRFAEIRSRDSAEHKVGRDFDQDLIVLLDAAVPTFADWCVIDILDQSGELRRFSIRHDQSTDKEIGTRDVSDTLAARVPDLASLQNTVVTAQRSETWPTSPGTQLPYCVVVALRVNELAFGTVTFVLAEGHPGYGPGELIAAEQIVSIVSSAIERVVLHHDARDAMRRAQRIASQLHQLIAASITVAGLNSEHDILRRLASSARNVFDADRAVVSLERGSLAPLCGMVVRNKPAITSATNDDPMFAEVPRTRPRQTAPWLDRTWLVAPILENRNVSRGVIAVERVPGADFSDEEKEILTLLAQMASTALGAIELSRTIQRSEARWRVLVETAPVGIVEVDIEGSIRWWNRAAGRIFAWPDFTDASDEEIPTLPVVVHQSFQALWSDALQGGAANSREFLDVEINGRRRHLAASAAALPSGNSEVRSLLTLVDDITDQREIKQELRHAHQMELRGQVASSVAHDFNNFLTLISGYAEMLSQNLRDDEKSLGMVRDIQTTASRASHLTVQLQAIGRTQSTESVILDPVALIQSNAEVLERIVGVDIELSWSLATDSANVKVDADQFEQMILNLAINARDAMPSGGRLRIAVSDLTLEPARSLELGRPVGEYVKISVADSGIGMDEKTQLHCFDPLFTTKGPFKGTGMGLAAARRLVEQSEGSIRCTSAPGAGTTFDILLPAVREDTTIPTPALDIDQPRGSATILLVEDDGELRKLMVQVLRRSGYVVLEAGSAEIALEIAHTTELSIDLLVSDVVMDALSGSQLARTLQNSQPGLRVLLMSGTADAKVLDDLNAETAAFLAKPFKPSQLVDNVHNLLARRSAHL